MLQLQKLPRSLNWPSKVDLLMAIKLLCVRINARFIHDLDVDVIEECGQSTEVTKQQNPPALEGCHAADIG